MKPSAISRNSAEADELIASLATPPTPAPAEPTEREELVQPADPGLPPGPEVVQSGQLPGFAEDGPEASSDGAGGEGGEGDEPSPPDDGDGDDVRKVKHHNSILQGRLRAQEQRHKDEVTQLRQDNAALRDLIAGFNSRMERMEARAERARPEPEPAKPAFTPATYAPVTDREREEHGDILDVAARAAAALLDARFKAIEQRIGELQPRVEQAEAKAGSAERTTAKTARDRTMEAILAAVPNFEVVNKDPEFLRWLGEEDEFSGEPRQALLTRAFNKHDAQRVIRFFKTYLQQTGVSTGGELVADTPPAAPNSPNGAGGGRPRVDPATLVAPARGRSAPRNGTQPQIMWTQKDIADFYADVKAGRFKSNPGEAERLERDLFAAQSEGRVQVQ